MGLRQAGELMGDTIGDVIAVVIFALLVFVMFSIELDPDLLGVRP